MKNIKILFAGATIVFALNAQAQDRKINSSELPKNAVAFLDTHFKNNAIAYASLDQDTNKKSFEVRLTDGTEVEFHQSGEWKEIDGNDKAIPTAFIPAEILTCVSKNYATESITHIDKSKRHIEVELSNGIELEFDTAGKFLNR